MWPGMEGERGHLRLRCWRTSSQRCTGRCWTLPGVLGQGGTREDGGQGREERREGSLLAMSGCREAREVEASWAL